MRPTIAKLFLVGLLFFGAAMAKPDFAGAQNDADRSYKANCISCHGAAGSGGTPAGRALQIKDLRSDEVQKKSDVDLAAIIAAGTGKMPGFARKLKPEDIQKLVAYIRTLPKSR